MAAALCMLAAPASAQTITPNVTGAFGNVTLSSGFMPDPHDVTLPAGGTVQANTVDANCAGMIAVRPDVSLTYTAGTLPLYLSATSEADTTLVVRGPDNAWYCNDDSDGTLNPSVAFASPASGRYQIWVGVFAGTDTPQAVLHISELASSATANEGVAPDASLPPGAGTVALTGGFTPDPHTQAIIAGGSYDATGLGVAGCVGWIAGPPDYRVNWTAGSGALPLIFSVQSDADTTLAINDAQGNWVCDDDSGNAGLNPSIVFQGAVSGQYDVWVGSFAQGEYSDSVLNISELYSQ